MKMAGIPTFTNPYLSVSLPIILYNVPTRTGVDIPVSVYQRLSRVPNIVGVKEASGSIAQMMEVIGEIKKLSPETQLIGFKLLDGVSYEELIEVATKLREKNKADYNIYWRT